MDQLVNFYPRLDGTDTTPSLTQYTMSGSDSLHTPIAIIGPERIVYYQNRACELLLGKAVLGEDTCETAFNQNCEKCVIDGTGEPFIEIVKTIKGRIYRVSQQRVLYDGKNCIREEYVDIHNEMLARQQAEDAQKIEADFWETSPDGRMFIDKYFRIKKVNELLLTMLGYSQEDLKNVLGKRIVDDTILSEQIRTCLKKEAEEKRHGSSIYRFEIQHKNGHKIWVSISVVKMRTGGFNITVRDITQRKTMEDDLQKAHEALKITHKQLAELSQRNKELALTDALTGLPNRRSFEEQAEREWERAKREEYPLFVLMADIDHFKNINDTHGHQAGDLCLQTFAGILQNCIRGGSNDVLARLGGEEFIILLTNLTEDEAKITAERIRKAVEEAACMYNEQEIKMTASFGLAQGPQNVESIPELQNLADKALYRAKNSGRNRVTVSEEMTPESIVILTKRRIVTALISWLKHL